MRSNRAARLRAAANGSGVVTATASVAASDAVTTEVDAQNYETEVTLRVKTSSWQREKDKSTKRKSNLNRALTEEQVSLPSQSAGNLIPFLSFHFFEIQLIIHFLLFSFFFTFLKSILILFHF